jgi:hypothetical protein
VFENRVLRRIFGLKRSEVTGGWRGLHIEPLHNLHFSPNLIDVDKAINMNGVRGMSVGYRWENQKERGYYEEQNYVEGEYGNGF